ncbi:MAG: Gldg family protein [Proteobacteria bacterium]|nr:Gldg family protein [Pseudomonadota bacterium]
MKHNIKNRVISGTGLILATCLFVAAIILVNATLTTWRIDLTENKLFTLSQGTINILENLEEPIQLDFYFSQKGMVDFPLLGNYGVRVRDMLEEFATHADGKLILNIIEPETFSEAEDQAVASGLRTVSASATSDRVYFGLVGTNSTDDEKIIPFFQTNRESALEYDLTKIIYNLAYPDKRVVGVISQLPIIGKKEKDPSWTIINALKEFFEVRDLTEDPDALTQKIDVLMLVHPKDLGNKTLYAIDQYLLRGGKAIIFLDPLAEQDRTQTDPARPNVLPKLDSYLAELLDLWGLEMAQEKIVGDINAAMRVQANSPRGPTEIDYLPWLRLTENNFNADDFSTSELNLVHMGTVGSIEVKEDKGFTITRLIETSKQSTKLERDLILFQRDPSVVLNNFNSEDKKLLLAARINGKAQTYFPEGMPADEDEGEGEKPVDKDFVSEGNINVILVSDTDVMADHFWVRSQNMFGVSVPQPIANNGDFIINSIENLAGNTDLISLRGRGKYSRPFEKVTEIRKEAETQFRQREKELQASLQETEKKIRELQQEQGDEKSYLLNNELTAEIEKFRNERIATRKELRSVQHELKKNIEKLGAQLRFINIGLIPLLITLLALMIGIYQANKRI